MKQIDISGIVGIWFHDVTINDINIDYIHKEVSMNCTIPIGLWNSPNRFNISGGELRGNLVLSGLQYIVIEPPDIDNGFYDCDGIEITSEGSVTSERILSKLPQDLPDDAFLQYFFVTEWNACIYVAATDIRFEVNDLHEG